MTNPLVPSQNWSGDPWKADQPSQVIYCWVCVNQGITEPPEKVVIAGGVSYCLGHALPQAPPDSVTP